MPLFYSSAHTWITEHADIVREHRLEAPVCELLRIRFPAGIASQFLAQTLRVMTKLMQKNVQEEKGFRLGRRETADDAITFGIPRNAKPLKDRLMIGEIIGCE